jgi:hypothetical protein
VDLGTLAQNTTPSASALLLPPLRNAALSTLSIYQTLGAYVTFLRILGSGTLLMMLDEYRLALCPLGYCWRIGFLSSK